MRSQVNSENTKLAISAALKDLVQQNKTDKKITIQQICDACAVNRNTFYYHFSDLPQLIRWTIHQDLFLPVEQLDVGNGARQYIMDYLVREKKFLRYAAKELGHDSLKYFLGEELTPFLQRFMKNTCLQLSVELGPEFYDFVLDLYSEAVSDLFLEYLKHPDDRYSQNLENQLIMIFDCDIPATITQQDKFHLSS